MAALSWSRSIPFMSWLTLVPCGGWAATGVPQQPANITSGLPYLGEDNVFYMLPPRDNTSYQGAFNEFYYDLPINHLPGIHWCAPPSVAGAVWGHLSLRLCQIIASVQ